ncbi:MAG: hypothetical protein QNJ74_20550 [Trichodesmium sp. MO_231.B1]|uniref:hypothetical protein n=1 Tax=Okeania sp. SIO2F4 TaxID=2607790 RepID=UPI0025EE5472|nr:hypothetical protein [Okeania sp. SIO2F4]MDJ0518541.1 hypothetical protein [Trichodesmium sp. MO_231.B1]
MTEQNVPKERAIVEVENESSEITSTSGGIDPKQETQELMEAIKRLAQSEMEAAGEFTRDSYIQAVKQARETIERIRLIDPQKIEETGKKIEKDIETNWETTVKEVQDFGDRLVKAGQAAWDVLTKPKE